MIISKIEKNFEMEDLIMASKKAVYFFCIDESKDEVAPRVLEHIVELFETEETDIEVDGYKVLKYVDESSNIFYFVKTKVVICENYINYIPPINQYFEDCDIAAMVNWHAGQNAPDKVLCIHTVGDLASARYSPSNPVPATNLARALENHRERLNLEEFRVTTEATHWSGIVYDGKSEWIEESKLPFLDIEIGSTSESFNNPVASKVIALALMEAFTSEEKMPTVLYMGGVHFEDTITNAVLHPTHPVSLTHILPSRWLENEMYMGENGVENIMKCIESISGSIDAIVIHEKLKREIKNHVEVIAEKLAVPVIKRKALKNPKDTELYENII